MFIEEKFRGLIERLDEETYGHSVRVAKICADLAGSLDLRPEKAAKIGLLHDIGKFYIAPSVLFAPQPITELEADFIGLHSYIGYKILKDMGEGPEIYLPVLYHHGVEKPKLRPVGEKFTDRAYDYMSIVHYADVYDAMTSPRVYRQGVYGFEEVKSALLDDMFGKRPDDILIDALAKVHEKKNAGLYDQDNDEEKDATTD